MLQVDLPATAGRACVALAALVAGACLPCQARAQTGTLNGTVALSSQLVDRGLAVTPETAVLQGAASWTLPSGWSFGASASTEVRDATPLAAVLVQASHYWRVAPDWQMQAGLVYYDYPGLGRGAFNRTEGSVNWIYRDVLTLGVSAIYPSGGTDRELRGATDLDFHWPLPLHLALSAGAGYAQAQLPYYRHVDGGPGIGEIYRAHDRVHSYGYGHLGLIWSLGAWHMEVDRMFVDPSIRRANLAAASWVGTVSWSF
jgi:uncharacterized protein (TIGR02001 family)